MVLVCGMRLVLCMWAVGGECGDTVVEGLVCFHVCRLGVVGTPKWKESKIEL